MTTFTYDTRHNLLEIVDPLGNRAFRGEYDADGRLICDHRRQRPAHEMSHDLAGREELMTDARGNVTRVAYDDGATSPERTDGDHRGYEHACPDHLPARRPR